MNKNSLELSDFTPASLPISIRRDVVAAAMDTAAARSSWVLAFVIGTKPCFNKVYGALQACHRRGLPLFVIDSNQHYDATLVHGLQEFDFERHVGVNLQLRGGLVQKAGELFYKTGRVASWLRENWPGVTVVPVVNGDTILCPMVPAAWMFARGEKSIQNEAGLRSMSPDILQDMLADIPLDDLMQGQWGGPWRLMRTEPFPEQWDTYVSAAACEYHMAPVELNRQHLLREGYPEEHIYVTGGVVVDALQMKRAEKPPTSIFEQYPELGRGSWIRLDIHRKENLGERRFCAIFEALETLVHQGHSITFVLMNATRHAITRWGLHDRLEALKRHPCFLATDVWPSYGHVVEFYASPHCLAAWTDSGGVQEDMNLLGKPCLTSRFNTDRPETVMGNHGNLLVPPISSAFISRVVGGIVEDPTRLGRLAGAAPLYGERVGEHFADAVAPHATAGASTHRWSQEILGYGRDPSTWDTSF
jgi:UDP-N-acetylglucosamine 2-epimerase (non-hydrolysing)